jgi:hypothetical protein
MCLALSARALRFATEYHVEVTYRGHRVGFQRLDLVVGDVVAVELKSVERLDFVHKGAACAQPTCRRVCCSISMRRPGRSDESFCEKQAAVQQLLIGRRPALDRIPLSDHNDEESRDAPRADGPRWTAAGFASRASPAERHRPSPEAGRVCVRLCP